MIKKPLISIIMNCFNGEDYIQQSIESIISQTYQNWELIFWDNNSSDKNIKTRD
jgi:glycosyltransferase involved in cell wall biosynthesis